MIDTHVHTKHCPHAKGGEMSEYIIEAFNSKRLRIIGFSEHFPLPKGFKDPAPIGNENAMLPESLGPYIQDVLDAKKKNSNVLLGIEMDWIPEYEPAIRENLLKIKGSLDYVVGSVHFLKGNWSFDYDDNEFQRGLNLHYGGNINSCIDDYFNTLQQMIKADLINVVAHIDLIKKFNKNEIYFSYDNEAYKKGIEETLELIKEKDLILEVNTGGRDKTVGEMYPSKQILEKCYELGIKLTLGSDAHKPEEVGRYFDRAIDMLKEIGYNKIHYVQNGNIKSMDV